MRGTLGGLLLEEKKEKDLLASSEKAHEDRGWTVCGFCFLIILFIYVFIFGYSESSLLRAGFFL